ncbi:DUF2953 domain-containing protein [Desulfosporosinus sp. BICA1-9]|uniref:DUF2953 domain-containing protein n=1 Tax=Desulfosporosinus sp. BICA1-9 TaxID=1531958 RepID=UPI00054C2CF3|nr:DUF2953 domain-containing protein [Desulfosporosinus sp. BICA1-9]KJS47962.1 MAG: hypothetical protein VR66_16720 [Peptococcaceae bacterium BRH_c23]KJS88789.1 MAG: hypothetical protein JL57_10685 [Desulfosporosinus sp. BICA1-9]HBW34040.1 DUF2953 domain-containing protein [Desulfosporosinus sp.]
MFVLSILGYILLGIGLLVTAIILIPYHYQASGEKLDVLQTKLSISWLFGGIKLNFKRQSKQKTVFLTVFGLKKFNMKQKSTRVPSEKDKEHSDKAKIIKRKKLRNNSNFIKFLRVNILKKVLATILKLFKYCQPKELSIDAKIGFDNPMYTGLMCAFHSQLYALFDKKDINIQPVFDVEILEGRFLIGGRIWLPYLILVMIEFLITNPIRNILMAQLKTKIKGGLQYVR